ncbi:MAG: hypothetical protein JG718_07955 [Candidatus Thiothrix moscowensis]|nr:hypothetical protein [Candidatus Thiothrix moscowensis]
MHNSLQRVVGKVNARDGSHGENLAIEIQQQLQAARAVNPVCRCHP